MYYVYILQSKQDLSLYIGYSTDLKSRIKAHNSGKSIATKNKKPWKLIYYEVFLNRLDAKKREIYLKSGWDRKTINKMLNNFFGEIA